MHKNDKGQIYVEKATNLTGHHMDRSCSNYIRQLLSTIKYDPMVPNTFTLLRILFQILKPDILSLSLSLILTNPPSSSM